jgi:hypothetical protein
MLDPDGGGRTGWERQFGDGVRREKRQIWHFSLRVWRSANFGASDGASPGPCFFSPISQNADGVPDR